MTLSGLLCADVPLITYTLTHSYLIQLFVLMLVFDAVLPRRPLVIVS